MQSRVETPLACYRIGFEPLARNSGKNRQTVGNGPSPKKIGKNSRKTGKWPRNPIFEPFPILRLFFPLFSGGQRGLKSRGEHFSTYRFWRFPSARENEPKLPTWDPQPTWDPRNDFPGCSWIGIPIVFTWKQSSSPASANLKGQLFYLPCDQIFYITATIFMGN